MSKKMTLKEAKKLFKVGDVVTLKDNSYRGFWGVGTVVKIVKGPQHIVDSKAVDVMVGALDEDAAGFTQVYAVEDLEQPGQIKEKVQYRWGFVDKKTGEITGFYSCRKIARYWKQEHQTVKKLKVEVIE